MVRAKLHNDFFDNDIQSIARYCFEAGTLAGVISYVVFQQGEEIMNQGLSSFMRGLVSDGRDRGRGEREVHG